MKRLSVRLAAGAAVIMLGLLAVAQAQRDRQLNSETDWELSTKPETEQPNAPLAAENAPAEWPAPPDTEIYRGNDPAGSFAAETSPPPASSKVQLAAHEQPVSDDDQAPNLSLGMPVAAAADPADEPATTGPAASGFALPGDPAGSPEATMPSPAAFDAPDDAQPVDEADMPAFQPDSGPAFSMSFTGVESAGEPPAETNSAAPPSESGPAAPPQQAPASVPSAKADGLSSRNVLRSPPTNEIQDDAAATMREPAAGEASGPASETQSSETQPPSQANGNSLAPADSGGYEFRPAEVGTLTPEETPAAMPPTAHQPPRMISGPASGTASGSFESDFSGDVQTQGMAQADRQAAGPVAAVPAARIASRDTAPLSQLEHVLAAPGERHLDGAQAPSVLIHKRAPEEVNVGKPATFVIQVQNVGTTDALNVQIFDRVPQGMRLVDATPSPERVEDLLTWSLGAIEPGGERSLTMQLIPEQEGELGSVARVTFEAAASVRTISTRPELRISQRAPEKVLIGQQLEIEILIENVGSGAASNVVLQEDVPEGLEHPKGRQLDNLVGTLAPGESRSQTLRLRATGAGKISNVVELVAEDGLTAQHAVDVEVVAPQLVVELQGPSRRYLERQATYNVSIANRGTATATDVELVATLDRGFTFVSTEFEGQYDPARHAVYWSLAELPAGEQGLVPLTLLPVEEGEQAVRLEAAAALGMQVQSEKLVKVDTLAELTFAVADNQDPIETASETTYEIRVANTGTRDDTNVQLRVELPEGLQLESADRKAGTDNQGMIVFEPLERIAPQQEELFRIRVRGQRPGTHVIKAVLTSDQASVPVTKEESTRVYSDQ